MSVQLQKAHILDHAAALAQLNLMLVTIDWNKANLICSGVFPSRMTNFGVTKYMDTLLAGQPTGRVGKPQDFAGLVLFLSSQASAHITGNVFVIDGGAMVSGWRRKKAPAKL